MNPLAIGLFIGVGLLAISAAAQEPEQGRPSGPPPSDQSHTDKQNQETPEQKAESQDVFNKYKEVDKYIRLYYGDAKGNQIQGMSNQEIKDLHDFMFVYADIKNKGANKKPLPADLVERLKEIRSRYGIFTSS